MHRTVINDGPIPSRTNAIVGMSSVVGEPEEGCVSFGNENVFKSNPRGEGSISPDGEWLRWIEYDEGVIWIDEAKERDCGSCNGVDFVEIAVIEGDSRSGSDGRVHVEPATIRLRRGELLRRTFAVNGFFLVPNPSRIRHPPA